MSDDRSLEVKRQGSLQIAGIEVPVVMDDAGQGFVVLFRWLHEAHLQGVDAGSAEGAGVEVPAVEKAVRRDRRASHAGRARPGLVRFLTSKGLVCVPEQQGVKAGRLRVFLMHGARALLRPRMVLGVSCGDRVGGVAELWLGGPGEVGK
ncbi:hypothetical protein GC173_11445 [bacterium]|nr:hypothetical protein [bacterium]